MHECLSVRQREEEDKMRERKDQRYKRRGREEIERERERERRITHFSSDLVSRAKSFLVAVYVIRICIRFRGFYQIFAGSICPCGFSLRQA